MSQTWKVTMLREVKILRKADIVRKSRMVRKVRMMKKSNEYKSQMMRKCTTRYCAFGHYADSFTCLTILTFLKTQNFLTILTCLQNDEKVRIMRKVKIVREVKNSEKRRNTPWLPWSLCLTILTFVTISTFLIISQSLSGHGTALAPSETNAF